jgi:hypothetical protein
MAYLDLELGDTRPVVSIVSSYSELPLEVDSLVVALNNFPLGIQAWELHPTSPQFRSAELMESRYLDHAAPSIAHILVVGRGFPHLQLDIPFDVARVELQYLTYWHERAKTREVPYIAALWTGSHKPSHSHPGYARLREDLQRGQECFEFDDVEGLCHGVLSLFAAIGGSRDYEYDVAISFAGADREIARSIAMALRQRGLRVFFDEFHAAELWGTDLAHYFGGVFDDRARYCLMLTSRSYPASAWATHERRHAQSRQAREPDGYILQVRLDETRVPGIPATIGYHTYSTPETVADLLMGKLAAGRRLKQRLK